MGFQENATVIKYFYVLRPILACGWIKDRNTPPPMEFNVLFESGIKDGKLKNVIKKLLESKVEGYELRHGRRIGVINNYIEDCFSSYEQIRKDYSAPKIQKAEQLDNLFRTILNEAWTG